MFKCVVLALALSAFVAANHKFTDTRSVLAEIDSEHFGKTILSMVQTQVQAKGSADEINLLLNQLITGILSDQKNHDQVNRTDQAACDRITLDLDNDVQYHTAQIAANEALRDDNTAALSEAEADVRTVTKDIEQNENTQTSEQNTRNQQHATWESKTAAINNILDGVDDAQKLVQHLSLGTSFAQLKSRYETVQNKLRQADSHAALLKPIISALTELSTHVDQKAIQKILQLLKELRQQLVNENNNLQEVEEKQAANWATFSEHLHNEHSRLSDRKAQLEQAISLYKDNIETAVEFVEYHTLELENAEQQLAAQENWCEAQAYIYDTQSVERVRQNEIVQRIQEHLIEKFSTTAQYLAGRF